MKKKMIMVAMILGALSLGSCVDNNESASVEAVRGAKAEQLKSIAVLNNATAEATLILAKAEAAINEAIAEGKKIENESAGIELEIKKAGLTEKLAEAQAKAEADLLNAKASLETAKANLIAAMDKVTIAEKTRVQTLLGEANTILGRIDTNRQALIDAKFQRAGLVAGLDGVKASQEKAITTHNRTIATSQALIAEYGKYSQTSKEEALKAYNEVYAKAHGLDKALVAAEIVSEAAEQNVTAAKDKVIGSVYLSNATDTKSETIRASVIEYTYSDGIYGNLTVAAYTKHTADTEKMDAAVNEASRLLIIGNSELADATKALNVKKETEDYKAKVKAVADAKTVWTNAATTEAKRAAKAALDAAENALKAATTAEDAAVKTTTENVANLTANLNTATSKLNAVNASEAEYTTLVKAWEDAMKAETEARIAEDKVRHDFGVQYILADFLWAMAEGTIDIADKILDQERVIAEAKAAIAEIHNIDTAEELITLKDRTIAELEQKVKIDEAAYADYMAQIKAIIEAAN